MRDGNLYRVDRYFVVQKITKPKTNLYLDKSTTQTKLSNVNENSKENKNSKKDDVSKDK